MKKVVMIIKLLLVSTTMIRFAYLFLFGKENRTELEKQKGFFTFRMMKQQHVLMKPLLNLKPTD